MGQRGKDQEQADGGQREPDSQSCAGVEAAEQGKQANSLRGMAMAAGGIAGPAIAGVLVVTTSPGITLLVDAASFAASAALLTGVHRDVRGASDGRFLADLREGYAEVRSRTWLWTTILALSIVNTAAAGFPVLGALVIKQHLGGTGSDRCLHGDRVRADRTSRRGDRRVECALSLRHGRAARGQLASICAELLRRFQARGERTGVFLMRRCRAAVLSLVVLVTLVGAPLALAGAPGHWTRLTDTTAANIDEVTLARAGDGVLHVAWSRPTPGSSGRDLLEVPISASGQVGARVVAATNWATIGNPFLVPTGGSGLDIFVGAVRSINAGETVSNLAMFTSADGGQNWALDPLDVTSTGAAYSSDVAAALGADGTPFESWGSSSCLCVHRGVAASTANVDFQQGLGDFGNEPGMAFDPATKQLVVAWYSNGTGHAGIYAAQVDQSTGAAASAQQAMPGTGNLLDGPFGGRTPLVARPGGGLYVAYEGGYPTHTRVLLWRVGSGSSFVLAQNPGGVQSVGLASTPTGRLWVFWSARNHSGSPIIYARRSNAKVTLWGATVVVGPPPHAGTSWNLVGNGQGALLDLVGSFSLGSSSLAASWHTQVLPGLSLSASVTKLRAHTKHAQKVTFRVFDAGAPVGGATVRVGNVKGKTNGKGLVKLALGPFAHSGRISARVSLSGYVGATMVLSIR